MTASIPEFSVIPSRRSTPATFSDDMDTTWSEFPAFIGGANDLAVEMNTIAAAVTDDFIRCTALANFRGEWSTLSGAMPVPKSLYVGEPKRFCQFVAPVPAFSCTTKMSVRLPAMSASAAAFSLSSAAAATWRSRGATARRK